MKDSSPLRRTATERFGRWCVTVFLLAGLCSCATRPPALLPSSSVPAARLPVATAQAPSPPAISAPSAASAHAADAGPAAPASAAPVASPVPVQVEAVPPPEAMVAPVDKAAALQAWAEQQDRLYRVAAPLLINNAALCPEHERNLLGLTAKTERSYSDEFVAEARSVLGLDNRLRVMSVLPGSGAALAGVLKGDILAAVGIEPLPQGPEAESTAASLVSSEMKGRTTLSLTVLREGEHKQLQVPLGLGCAMTINVGNADHVNAYADGERVMVTRGMLHFVRSDQELAYVLAKEIAHNVLTPSTRPDISAVIDQMHTINARIVAGAPGADLAAYSSAADAAADELALYLLARAGYRIDGAPEFWQRLATGYPAEVREGFTAQHPSTAYRLSAMSQTIEAIRLKQEKGLPLVP